MADFKKESREVKYSAQDAADAMISFGKIVEGQPDVDKPKSAEELHVKVSLDVSEALTGLKAVTRQAREATKALRELESDKIANINELRDIQGREDLTKVVKVDGGIEGVDFYSCNERDICCSDQCSRLRQNEETSGALNEAVEYKPVRASELTVTIDADVDEAVAGLKRLQREIRKTTQEVREMERAYKDVEEAYKRLK